MLDNQAEYKKINGQEWQPEETINKRLIEIEDEIILIMDNLKAEINENEFDFVAENQFLNEKWNQAIVVTILCALTYKVGWYSWSIASKMHEDLIRIKSLFVEYFTLSGACKEHIEFLERPFIFEFKSHENSEMSVSIKNTKKTFVDGFIMEGKSEYCESLQNIKDCNILLEYDFLYRSKFTNGKNKDLIMLNILKLMPAFNMVTSKILPYKDFSLKKNTIIDRSPFCCAVFDGVNKKHVLLDLMAWNLCLNNFNIRRTETFNFELKIMLNMTCVLPDSEKRKFEKDIYFPEGFTLESEKAMTRSSVSYYLTLFILIDNLREATPAQGIVLFGKLNNRNLKVLNSNMNYFAFMIMELNSIMLTDIMEQTKQTKSEFIQKLINNRQTYYLENDHFKIHPAELIFNLPCIESIVSNYNLHDYTEIEMNFQNLFIYDYDNN